MFGISGTELFLILLFGFLIFGPDKLPEIAKTIGRGIAKFKSAQEDMNSTLQGQIFDPNSDEPFKDPVQALDKLAQKAEEKDQKPASGTAAATAAAGAAAPATQQRATGAGNAVRQESFTERKARYERERAARRAEEERRAKEAAAAPAAGASASQPATSAASAQSTAAAATAPAAPAAASTSAAPAASAAGTQSAPGSDAAAATSERGE
ncbi:MAG: twin-arginine translocase TatA/TatE family subunit [Eggerthellaceae bacterium]